MGEAGVRCARRVRDQIQRAILRAIYNDVRSTRGGPRGILRFNSLAQDD
jgi:hypothetical protein